MLANHRQSNIFRVYCQASAEEIAAGLQWYQSAHDEAVRLGLIPTISCNNHSLGYARAAGIIAAVSPGLRWERNVEVAERIIRGESLDGLGVRWYDGVRKARRILAGGIVERILRGPKVRAFYQCILDPEASLSVCIDGHAYAIWAGQRINLDDIPPFNERFYSRISADYWQCALHVGVKPCQLQAVTWVTWRRLFASELRHGWTSPDTETLPLWA